MGNTPSVKNDEPEKYKKFLRPGVRITDIKNLTKAFKLLDKDGDGYIQYDIDKLTDSKKNEKFNYIF